MVSLFQMLWYQFYVVVKASLIASLKYLSMLSVIGVLIDVVERANRLRKHPWRELAYVIRRTKCFIQLH